MVRLSIVVIVLSAVAGCGTSGAKLATFGNDPYKQRLRVAIGSPNAPDVFFNWGGGNLEEYVDAGRFATSRYCWTRTRNSKTRSCRACWTPPRSTAGTTACRCVGAAGGPVLQQEGLRRRRCTAAQDLGGPDRARGDVQEQGSHAIALAGSQAWTELTWAEYLLDRIGGPEAFRAIRDGKDGAWGHPAMLDALTKISELVATGAFGKNYATVGYDVGGASTLLA